MKVMANKDELGEVRTEMKTQSERFEEELRKLSEQVDTLETIWSGADATTFYNAVRNYINKLVAVPDALRVINNFMGKTTDQIFDKDNQFGNAVNMGVDYHDEQQQ